MLLIWEERRYVTSEFFSYGARSILFMEHMIFSSFNELSMLQVDKATSYKYKVFLCGPYTRKRKKEVLEAILGNERWKFWKFYALSFVFYKCLVRGDYLWCASMEILQLYLSESTCHL